MCGLGGIFGHGTSQRVLDAMVTAQHHRGPDDQNTYLDPNGLAGLAHNRLSIIDLSQAGRQPMNYGPYHLVFNGEIYNYLELREELSGFPYRSRTDSEVLLAAYERWGEACLEHLVGMFAFIIWDERNQSVFAARDRFGVKPLYYSLREDGTLLLASEIRTMHAAGVSKQPDESAWATYLASGLHDHSDRTFWTNIATLPPGHFLTWKAGALRVQSWYDLEHEVGQEFDSRPIETAVEEYRQLLLDSVRLRFRSDVAVGINISGGLDSSTLLALVQAVDGISSKVKAFTYVTGDPAYDELPWVQKMLARTQHPCIVSRLSHEDVPELARSVQRHESEPFGGLPTLAYAKLFETAKSDGVTVLLDGQGMDEQWAGYDYYLKSAAEQGAAPVQGTSQQPLRPSCLVPEFRARAEAFEPRRAFSDALRNRQYWDTRFTKIPRALRFNDRISMRCSLELREPFLDHRLFALAFRQPVERKIVNGTRKWLLREVTRQLLPCDIVEAPKRPLQTPQREWLRGPLKPWAEEQIEAGLSTFGGCWLDAAKVRQEWKMFCRGESDNSFYVWQWVSLGLMATN
jgi:asparagine synthase (glutamine-hydrolysing)